MNIAIFVPYIGNFGNIGFYNSQDIGISKKIHNYVDKVFIVRLHDKKIDPNKKVTRLNEKIELISIPSKRMGHHGLVDTKEFDLLNFDTIFIFSDNQICIPKIHRYLKRKNKKIIYYIGVLKSNSNSFVKKAFMDLLTKRNIKCYKEANVFAKTPQIIKELEEYKVKNIELLPVGLDEDLLKKDYKQYDKNELRKKFGLNNYDKVLLFIGRLEEEKRPLEMVKIFKKLNDMDESYKLIIIGKGKLKDQLFKLINEFKLTDSIIYFESVMNKDIWQFYYISDIFINLNKNEIFGMSILEAMYYECPVIAHIAPGPEFIIDNYKNGILINNDDEIYQNIKYIAKNKEIVVNNGKSKLQKYFLWNINNIIEILKS